MRKLQLPSINASHKLFRTVARKMLMKHGLSATLLDDLSAGMAPFAALRVT